MSVEYQGKSLNGPDLLLSAQGVPELFLFMPFKVGVCFSSDSLSRDVFLCIAFGGLVPDLLAQSLSLEPSEEESHLKTAPSGGPSRLLQRRIYALT